MTVCVTMCEAKGVSGTARWCMRDSEMMEGESGASWLLGGMRTERFSDTQLELDSVMDVHIVTGMQAGCAQEVTNVHLRRADSTLRPPASCRSRVQLFVFPPRATSALGLDR